MPLRSMTGFGGGSADASDWRLDVELSSVNRKQFDVSLGLPRELAVLESRAVARIRDHVRRGHVRGAVRLQGPRGLIPVVDIAAARTQIEGLREAAAALGLPDDLRASDLLRLPPQGASDPLPPLATETAWTLLDAALQQALAALSAMRAAEGAALEADLRLRLSDLARTLPTLRACAPGIPRAHRDALLKRLAEADVPIASDDPALLRELALFADRCDISEELARLESHFAQATELLASTEPCGRALDFLCQEFHREINTIGSKAGDASVARLVIAFKAGLEAFREQVQNIE